MFVLHMKLETSMLWTKSIVSLHKTRQEAIEEHNRLMTMRAPDDFKEYKDYTSLVWKGITPAEASDLRDNGVVDFSCDSEYWYVVEVFEESIYCVEIHDINTNNPWWEL